MIRITKLNCGVEFQALTKTGKPVKRNTMAIFDELARARNWYASAVASALQKYDMTNTGYGQSFLTARFKVSIDEREPGRVLYELEPYGWAIVNESGEAQMGNTGSTPTPGRTKILLCYQAPLEKKRNEDGTFTFQLTKEFP